MAIFKDCTATGNLGGGFYTSSPFTVVNGAVAANNIGPGFVDDSGNGQFASLMRELLAAGASPEHVQDVHSATGNVMAAVYSGDKKSAFQWYSKVVELAAAHATILAPLLGPLERVLSAKWPV